MGVVGTPSRVRAYDSFTRADSTTALGRSESGQPWLIQAGTWGVASGKAYNVSGTTIAAAVLEIGVSNAKASVTMDVLDNEQGLMFRYKDQNNFWRLIKSGGSLLLQKRASGATSTVLNIVSASANGDVFTVSGIDAVITVFQNGSEKNSAIDAFNQTETKYGLGCATGAATTRWNDFVVEV